MKGLDHCNHLALQSLCGHLIVQTIKHISSLGHIAQWLERVLGKHKVVGTIPTHGQPAMNISLQAQPCNLKKHWQMIVYVF